MKKIMFNDAYGLTQATIEGRKTMTRRLMNPQPKDCSESHKHCWGSEWANEPMKLVYDRHMNGIYCRYCGYGVGWDGHSFLKPAYKVGEVVAVAQRYADIPGLDDLYRIPGTERYFEDANIVDEPGYRNKMFVKAELMPHRIRITGIRAERLQDISDEDCIKEGIIRIPEEMVQVRPFYFCNNQCHYDTPRQAFAALIDKVSRRGTWASNPWVVAYEYELIK